MADTIDKSGEEHLGKTYDGEVGRYKILEIIGAGGMGVVCLGETEGTGRQVAVKFLHRELASESDSSRERFEREIKVLRDLKAFRGVVQIEDVGHADDGSMFLVMEYITGRPLNEIIEENPKGLPQMRAVQTVIEILIVLEPIHRTKKFIHRDLKPHNICVYEDPLNVRLLDFGLSKPFQEGSGYERVTRKKGGKAGEIPGSPHYMPEEQFLRPKEVDRRTDLYAVGIILYELLAGVPPFRGIYLQEILKQHRDKEAPPIETTAEGGPLSYRLWTVIEKSLAKSPESRYQTATEFREALEDVLKYLIKREQPKKAIDNRYRIIKKIGEGGNSEVFEAEDLVDNRQVALKIVKEGSSDWDEETLVNEADRALNHDNIVKIHDFGLFENRPALVMDFVAGGTVAELVKDYGDDGLPEAVFYRVAIDVCKGLHHAHQANIVHRDVKPENMLRTLDGRIKVADFGIAKRFETSDTGDVGSRNTVMAKGTAPYMSPEQCDLEGRADRRADVYSLGCVLYEMLCGQPPFTEGILLLQHLQNDPPPLKVKGDFKNPDELCRIVERCLKKRKDERYQSMKELAQDLVRVSKLKPQKKAHKPVAIDTGADVLTANEGGVSRDSTQTNRFDTSGTGRPGWMNVAMIAAAVIAIGGVAAFIMKGNDEPPVNPNPAVASGGGGEQVDPELLAAETLRERVLELGGASDWKGIAALDLAAFDTEAGAPLRQRSATDVLKRGRDLAGTEFADAAAVTAFGTSLREWGKAVAALDPESEVPAKAERLAAAVSRADATIKKSAQGLETFDESWLGEVQSARSALQSDVRIAAYLFDDFAEAQRTRTRDDNLIALQGRLSAGGEALGDDEVKAFHEVLNVVTRNSGAAAARPLLDAAEKHVASRLASLASPQDVVTWVQGEGARLAALDASTGASVFDFLRVARNDITSPNAPTARNSGAAVARALARHVQGDGFRKALREQFRADDPASWGTTLDSLAESGLGVSRFEPEYCAVFDVLATPELDAALDEAFKKKPAEAKKIRESVTGLRRRLPGLNTEARERLTALVPNVETDADAAKRDFARRMGEVRDAAQLDVVAGRALLEELSDLAEIPTSEQLKYDMASYGVFATDLLDRAERAKRPLAYCALIEAAKGLIPTASLATQRRRLATAYLNEIVRSGGSASFDAFGGQKNGKANAQWLESEEPLLGLALTLPEADRALLAPEGSLVLTAPDPALARRDQGELRYSTNPKIGFVAGDAERVALRVALELRLGDELIASISEIVRPNQAPKYDFEGPEFDNGTPMVRGEAIIVALKDAGGLGTSAPVVRVGSRELEAVSDGPSSYRYAVDSGLLDLKAAPGVKVLVRAVDAFGNVAENQSLSFGTVRTAIARAEGDRLRTRAKQRIEGIPVGRGASLGGFTRALDELKDPIVALRQIDRGAAQSAMTELFSALDTRLRRWLSAQPVGKDLEGQRSAFNGTVQKGQALARTLSYTWSGASGLASAFNDRARVVTAGGNDQSSPPIEPKPIKPDPVTPKPKPTPRPVRAVYKSVPLTVGGVRFIPVGSGRNLCWMAEVEMSRSFGEANAPAVTGRIPRKTRGPVALAPISAPNAKAIIAELNRTLGGQLAANGAIGKSAGGKVKFAIPTTKQWRAAAAKNGDRTYAAAGITSSGAPSAMRWRGAPTGRIDDQDIFYQGLPPVTRAYGTVFKGMAGYVSEIVSNFGALSAAGGHIRDVESGSRATARLKIKDSVAIDRRYTGLRLALVPSK